MTPAGFVPHDRQFVMSAKEEHSMLSRLVSSDVLTLTSIMPTELDIASYPGPRYEAKLDTKLVSINTHTAPGVPYFTKGCNASH